MTRNDQEANDFFQESIIKARVRKIQNYNNGIATGMMAFVK